MKLVEMKCKNCGAVLEVEEDAQEVKCKYCNTIFKIDDEVQHIQYDNAEKTGYDFEMGRIKAKQEMEQEAQRIKLEEDKKKRQEQIERDNKIREEEKKKKMMIWWILGWIFFFPIPLSIIIWKSNLEQKVKIGLLIALWGTMLIYGAFNGDNSQNTSNVNNTVNTTSINANSY